MNKEEVRVGQGTQLDEDEPDEAERDLQNDQGSSKGKHRRTRTWLEL